MRSVPRIAVLNVSSENSDYCNFTGDVKNSYLIFGSVYSESCYYGSPYYSKSCVDTLVLRDCELCYERIAKRNPRKLVTRNCDKCQQSITTSYPLNSPYKVYCEECYLKEVY